MGMTTGVVARVSARRLFGVLALGFVVIGVVAGGGAGPLAVAVTALWACQVLIVLAALEERRP